MNPPRRGAGLGLVTVWPALVLAAIYQIRSDQISPITLKLPDDTPSCLLLLRTYLALHYPQRPQRSLSFLRSRRG